MKEANKEMKTLLEEHERRISRLEAVLIRPGEKGKKGSGKKKLSVKEFVLLKNPKDDNLKTLCIAYYFEKYEGACCFNAKDLEKGFRLAKETPPRNINDRVNKNIARGFMMEAEEKKDKRKAWVLTSSGERFVEKGLENEKQ
jgi:hypothetical protein